MKKYIIKAFAALALTVSISACGNDFLETESYNGLDRDEALTSVSKIGTALNGTYYYLFYYDFAGNYAINIGDIPTDITYWNTKTNHFNALYQYNYLDTDSYLEGIWNYGYKVADGASRIIEAGTNLYETTSEEEKTMLDIYLAEAYTLRGYAQLILTNVFGHQVKVNGQDFSEQPGIVIADKPIEAEQQVSRSTVGKSYEAILSDLNNAISHFETAGKDQGQLVYFTKAAAYGLLARASLYLENWADAAKYAQDALSESDITELHYDAASYKALYNTATSNTESMFALGITDTQNWSANSSGTLWSTYNFFPSTKLVNLYADTDCRTAVMGYNQDTSGNVYFNGGKFAHFSSGNPAYATHYIVNAPEMFLIIAEANLQNPSGDLNTARNNLLTVAKRNSAITSVEQLGSTKEEVMSFLKDERARELFQEGLRLYDLRRWDELTGVNATGSYDNNAPSYTNYKISDLVYPIPAAEINAGFGVEQTEGWANTRPAR